MWYSPGEGDHGKGRRGEKDESAMDNADSGFLSAGSMQISGEIRDSGVQEPPQEGDRRKAAPASPGAMTSASPSPSATAAEKPARAVDSGVVDVELSEGLNQLTLKRQPGLNPLDGDGDLPTTAILELTPVRAGPRSSQRNDDFLLEQQYQREQGAGKRAIINEIALQQLYQDIDGDTHLHIAIMHGFVDAAIRLIRMVPHPCLLNISNNNFQSPLHVAVLTNQSLIVRRLILAGADPSLRNFRGNTALHLACINGDLACAKALTDPLSPIERNKLMPGQTVPALPQNLEQRNYNGEVCLHLAASNGHVNLVRLLLRLGADLEAREALAGKTALHLAMERRCQSVVNFLLQECKPCLDTQTYSGLTAYQVALCIDSQLARELVRYGAKPEPLPDSDSESSSENNSEDETYGEASYLPAIVKMQNAVKVNV